MVKIGADSVPRRALWRGEFPARVEVVKCRAGQMEGSQCVPMRELLKGPVWAGRGQGQGRGGSPAVGGRLVPQPQGFLPQIVFSGFERICLPLPILLPFPPKWMAGVQTSQHRPVPAGRGGLWFRGAGQRSARMRGHETILAPEWVGPPGEKAAPQWRSEGAGLGRGQVVTTAGGSRGLWAKASRSPPAAEM